MTTSTEYNRPDTAEREIRVLADARIRPMMGIEVLESLPHARIPYELVDPFILVHEAVVPITPERASLDTEHPHRGFDNLWYLLAARPAPATAPVQAARSSARGFRPDRS